MSDRKPCPNLETNKKSCACPNKTCTRHGFCCACVEYHLAAGNLPLCMRNLKKTEAATR